MMKKKEAFVMMMLLTVMSMGACNQQEASVETKPTDEIEYKIETVEETETVVEIEESEEVTDVWCELRDTCEQLDGVCSIAYVGYLESGDLKDLPSVLQACTLKDKYPQLLEIPEDHYVLAGGCDIYCIVPQSDDVKMTVKEIDLMQEGVSEAQAIENGTVVYEGNGSPILLISNYSDIVSNSYVTITQDDEVLGFSPYLSLKDGSLATWGTKAIFNDFSEMEINN